METIMLYSLVSYLQVVFPETVILTGPRYVKSGDSFWINCSSDIIPYGEIAEFSVNGVTVNALRRYKTRCISLTTNTECVHDICNCDEGKKFSLRLNGYMYAIQEQLDVECSMKYVAEKPFFETSNLSIQVIDLQGPKITSVSGTPMVDGRDINLICSAISTLDIGLEWKCLNVASPKEERKNETYIFITLTLNINRTYNGKECSCICKYKNFTSIQTIILHITNSPILMIQDNVACSRFSSITLTCYISGDLVQIGFSPWTHTVEGIFIRYLNGSLNGDKLSLLIEQCTFDDGGEYTCSAWNQDNNQKYWSNTTTVLTIEGESGFDFQKIWWALTALLVFILTVGVMAIIVNVRNVHGEISLKSGRRANRTVVYYAAPEDENNAHAYNTTNTGYEEPTGELFGHYSEILENFEGTNSSMADNHQYEEVHHYIEIQP